MSLTGKQTAFIHAYLGEARFNATKAAKLAGYGSRATSQHSFEVIGAENLLRPAVRAVIDEHWKLSRMTGEEVLIEITKLARGDSKDKLKALALMSAHHGLLDGRFEKLNGANELTLKAEYDRGWDACLDELSKDVEKYNAEATASFKKKDAQWQALIDKYQDSPIAVEALTELLEVMLGTKEGPELKPVEVEIIPPQRRLEPAPVERLMADVFETEIVTPEPQPEPETCQHGLPPGGCDYCETYPNAVVVNPDGTKTYTFGQGAR